MFLFWFVSEFNGALEWHTYPISKIIIRLLGRFVSEQGELHNLDN